MFTHICSWLYKLGKSLPSLLCPSFFAGRGAVLLKRRFILLMCDKKTKEEKTRCFFKISMTDIPRFEPRFHGNIPWSNGHGHCQWASQITTTRNDLAGDVLGILTGYCYLCLIFAGSRVLINDMMVFNQINQRATVYEFLCRTKSLEFWSILSHVIFINSRLFEQGKN